MMWCANYILPLFISVLSKLSGPSITGLSGVVTSKVKGFNRGFVILTSHSPL